jgi:hypothetical protein
MDRISSTTRVHVVLIHPDTKEHLYLVKPGTRRDREGRLILSCSWDADPQRSVPTDFQTATIIQRRLLDESNLTARLALTTNSNRFIGEGQ